jgi:hypothetical protein
MPFHQPAFDLLFNIHPALVVLVPVALILLVLWLTHYYDDEVMRLRKLKRKSKK